AGEPLGMHHRQHVRRDVEDHGRDQERPGAGEAARLAKGERGAAARAVPAARRGARQSRARAAYIEALRGGVHWAAARCAAARNTTSAPTASAPTPGITLAITASLAIATSTPRMKTSSIDQGCAARSRRNGAALGSNAIAASTSSGKTMVVAPT